MRYLKGSRSRPSTACDSCRRKKIKCDSNEPCGNCVKVGKGSTCSYSTMWSNTIIVNKDVNTSNGTEFGACIFKPGVKPEAKRGPLRNRTRPKSQNISSNESRMVSTKVKEGHKHKQLSRKEDTDARVDTKDEERGKPENNSSKDTWHTARLKDETKHEEDNINFNSGYSSLHFGSYDSRTNFSTLSWICFMKKDSFLEKLWNYSLVAFYNPGKLTEDGIEKLIFRSKKRHELPDKKMCETNDTLRNPVNSKLSVKHNSPYEGDFTEAYKFAALRSGSLKSLREVCPPLIPLLFDTLPTKQIFWNLIDRYFCLISPFIPVLDESAFRSSLIEIFGAVEYFPEKFSQINLETKVQIAVICSCLLILRITYASYFSNKSAVMRIQDGRYFNSDEFIQILKENKIGVEIFDVALRCLNCFNLDRVCNINVISAVILMKFNEIFLPNGDGLSEDSQLTNAMIVQMSFTIALNRDPVFIMKGEANDPKFNLLRKIWSVLYCLDTIQMVRYGNMSVIHESDYDTQEPVHIPGNENLQDKKLDFVATYKFAKYLKLMKQNRVVSSMVLQVNGELKLKDFMKEIRKLESLVDGFGDCTTILDNGFDSCEFYLNNFSLKSKLISYTLLSSSYFHLYIHYEKAKTEFSMELLIKLFNLFKVTIPVVSYVLHGDSNVFGLLETPASQIALHKFIQIGFAFIIRTGVQICNLKTEPFNAKTDAFLSKNEFAFEKLKEFLLRGVEYLKCSVAFNSNAQKLYSANLSCLNVVTSDSFYEKCLLNFPKGIFLGVDELDVIIESIGNVLVPMEEFSTTTDKECMNISKNCSVHVLSQDIDPDSLKEKDTKAADSKDFSNLIPLLENFVDDRTFNSFMDSLTTCGTPMQGFEDEFLECFPLKY